MGRSGGTQIYQPNPQQAPTPGQSARDYAAALPDIYRAALEYQPQFSELDYQDFARYAPLYTAISDQLSRQYNPETYAIQENLAREVNQNLATPQGQVPEWMRKTYQDQMNAQLGTNVNAGVGADYASRGLIDQAQNYRSYYQNLGLSLAQRQPLTSTQYSPSSFNVAGNTNANYGNALQAYGLYQNAARPMGIQGGTPNWLLGLNAAGNLAQGIGSMAARCWVASACFGGWYAPKTIWARFYVNYLSPKWFKNFYIKYGEKIAKNKLAVFLLKPVFEIFSFIGKRNAYGNFMV